MLVLAGHLSVHARVPPNAIKALIGENLLQVFEFITDFWNGEVDIPE